MRTGHSLLADDEDDDRRAELAYEVFLPVVETAIVIAAEYATRCGRGSFVRRDVEYALKFAARHVLGNQVGTFFPDLENEESSDEDASSGLSNALLSSASCEEPWSRYDGDDERMLLVNRAAETWDDWEPQTPAERLVKRCVDKASTHQQDE